MKVYDASVISKKIVQFCNSENKKFIFISGNGGSGKTELSRIISKEANKYGKVNCLEMDDFVIATKIRNNATTTWKDLQNKTKTGRYTTSFAESYFLQNIKAIIYNIEKGNNYYHWPKKAKTPKECKLLYGDAILTIIEGVGSVFLDKNKTNSVSIFLQCKKELELDRRITRAEKSNEKTPEEVNNRFKERNSQYKVNIKPHMQEHDIILESIEDFSLLALQDHLNILKRKS